MLLHFCNRKRTDPNNNPSSIMQHKCLILGAILLFALASCKDKKNSDYEGCCGTEPTIDTFHFNLMVTNNFGQLIDSTFKASVYIPNIIVIDSFGTDYSLFVFGSPAVNKITSFTCLDEQGDTLYSLTNGLPNDFTHGWNGVKPDGTPYKGVFDYKAVVEYINGQQKTYNRLVAMGAFVRGGNKFYFR